MLGGTSATAEHLANRLVRATRSTRAHTLRTMSWCFPAFTRRHEVCIRRHVEAWNLGANQAKLGDSTTQLRCTQQFERVGDAASQCSQYCKGFGCSQSGVQPNQRKSCQICSNGCERHTRLTAATGVTRVAGCCSGSITNSHKHTLAAGSKAPSHVRTLTRHQAPARTYTRERHKHWQMYLTLAPAACLWLFSTAKQHSRCLRGQHAQGSPSCRQPICGALPTAQSDNARLCYRCTSRL